MASNTDAVVVVDTGPGELLNLIRPSMEKYTKKLGIDLVILTEPRIHCAGRKSDYNYGRFEKLQAWYMFEHYDRILRLDSDILIHPNCPDIFETVPDDYIGVVYESKGGLWSRKKFRDRNNQTKRVMGNIKGWDHNHFNSGVMLLSSIHKDIWEPPEEDEWRKIDRITRLREQCFMNWRVAGSSHSVYPLSFRYNHCGMFRHRGPRTSSWILHYAGDRNRKKQNILHDREILNV